MIDFHVHPDFSPDAHGSVEEYCAQAQRIGLDGLCFTTHYEPDPARAGIERVVVAGRPQPVASGWAEQYFAAIDRARQKVPGLQVLAGVEVGYEPGLEGVIHDFLFRHEFDFVLGAVHCLDHVAITAGDELEQFKRDLAPRGGEAVAQRYCRHVQAAAGSQLFDCIAHLDIYRKYIVRLLDESFTRAVDEGMPDVLGQVARSGTGLEVNTSALRRGSDEPYPDTRLATMARDAGVKVFTVGSDAHKPADLGRDLDRAAALLAGLGLKPARFQRRKLVD
jgi:histidinol-phosphatase (PHP family)